MQSKLRSSPQMSRNYIIPGPVFLKHKTIMELQFFNFTWRCMCSGIIGLDDCLAISASMFEAARCFGALTLLPDLKIEYY